MSGGRKSQATEEEPSRSTRLRRSLTDLHVRLRTEGDSPPKHGAAVALGTFLGCTPLLGLHLFLCTVLARLLRLSRVVTYLAAHINNPITFPFLVLLELKLGSRVLTGAWPDLSLEHVRSTGLVGLGRDLAVGSLLLGVVLGGTFGVIAWAISRRRRPSTFSRLREAVGERYLGAGVLHWEFVRGKMRYDPVFRGLLEARLLPRKGTVVDLGCGRGILLVMLATLAEADEDGSVPPMELVGIELRGSAARAARTALGEGGRIERGDVAKRAVPPCDTAILLDVLHYLPARVQEALLERIVVSLRPGGLLILREADDGGGWRFALTRAAERLRAVGRLHLRQRFHYRSRDAWIELLRSLGLEVDGRPMAEGTPYANVLLVGRKPPARGGAEPEPTPPLAAPPPPA